MAINIFALYGPTRAGAPTIDYPVGFIKNESVPGANDGTPLDQQWGNDYAGFDAALFAEAGVTPNGNPDTAVASQRLSALRTVSGKTSGFAFDSVADMVAGNPVTPTLSSLCKCKYGTEFIRISTSSGDISDFLITNEGDIRDFGATTSADNSSALAFATSTSSVIRVKGGNYNYNTFDVPAGVTIKIDDDSSLTLTQDSGLTFATSEYVETDVTTTGGKGTKTFTVVDGSLYQAGEQILMVYRDDITDPYYISIAQNPNEYGWQAQILTIESVSTNTIVTKEPLLFNLKSGYTNTIRKIVAQKTKIIGGKLVNASSASFHNGPADNLSLIGVDIDCANSLGMRFIRCAFFSFINCTVDNTNGNGGLFLGYGVVSSGVVDCEFKNGTGGDANLIWFAGCNNCISERNKFYGNNMLAGEYIGAKCWNVSSVDSEYNGGEYGLLTNFGARDLKLVRPRCNGQSLAGVFMEQTQHATVDNVRMKQDLLTSDIQTQGGLVLKDCDFSVKIYNPEIETNGGRTISVFNSPTSEVIRNNIHFIGGDLSGGRFQLENPVKNLKIIDVTSDGSIDSFFGYGSSDEGEITGNKVTNGKMSLRSMRNSNITDNEVDANGGSVGIELTGSTRFCILRRNRSLNADTAYSVPSTVSSRYSTAIYPDNVAVNFTNFIDNGVGASASFKPSLGIEAPRNFFVPLTNSDFTTAQTVSGYRSKGNGATDDTAWVRVLTSEDLV